MPTAFDPEHSGGDGHWGTVAETAQVFGVSADTIRRRIKRGDLETRREQTPQGFRWLIRLPDEESPASPQNAPRSPQTAETIDHGAIVVYGPDPRDTLIEALQRELELRNREVTRLHDVIGQQAHAIERATAALPATTRRDAPESTESPSPISEVSQSARRLLARLWTSIRGNGR